ncbi:MAG: TolC family protein [Melioribacteraceae bacterium]|nr:TolC family protein [Melioribacteraceae bacterium]
MRKYVVAILCLFFVSQTSAQNKLTLDDAIQIALQRNTGLIKSKNQIESAKTNVKSSYGDLLPNFGVSGSFGWQRIDDDGGTQTDFFGNLVDIPASTSENRSWSVSAGGSVTLFNGLANYATIKQSENDLESAEFSLNKLKQDIVQITADLYYSVLNAAAQQKVREDNVKYNEKLFETISERNRLGSVPIADVYAQQVQLGNAQLLLIQAENNLDRTKNSLLNYLALDVLEDYEFIDPFESVQQVDTESFMRDFGEVSAMVAEALNMRLDYKSQLLNVESASKGVTIAQSGFLPRLTGNYSYSTNATQPDNLFNRRTISAGLTLSLPIFSNWNTESAIQFAEVSYKNTLEDLSALERTIKIEVKQGYLDLLAGKKSLEVARENVKAAEENRRINYERYSLGSGTILDVLQSDRDYTQAVSGNIDAKFQFYKLRDNLMNALGKLDYKKFE